MTRINVMCEKNKFIINIISDDCEFTYAVASLGAGLVRSIMIASKQAAFQNFRLCHIVWSLR